MPQTQAEREGELALAALQAGQAALAAGDVAEAIAWLERAVRYAPDDPAPLLSLSVARLSGNQIESALAGFDSVARGSDTREAWLGLAVAALRLGRAPEAATAMAACLSRHRWDGARPVPDSVTQAGRLPGWCALAADGSVAVGLRAGGRAIVHVDGVALPRGGKVGPTARRVEVTLGGKHLLGSPIAAALIHRVEGVVSDQDGGLGGWAWHPGDAGRDPVLRLSCGAQSMTVVAMDQSMASLRPLTRPRRFAVPAAALAGFEGPIEVLAEDGRALSGSPVDPAAPRRAAAAAARLVAARWPWRGEPAAGTSGDAALCHVSIQAAIRGAPASARSQPGRPAAIVVPVYRGLRETLDCLAAVRRTTPAGTAIIAVDDASPEPELVAALDVLAADGAVRLVRMQENLGFPGAANAGMRAAADLPGGPDVVLLNSDTLAAPGWLDQLRAAVHQADDIGTASPLSNDATILSYPDPRARKPAPPPEGSGLDRLARQAARANAGVAVEIPTAVGFCMYIRRECLEQTGLLRTDLFAQGYGEENDFCLRARHLGWRHVAVPGAFVAHLGGHSFGLAREALIGRNMQVLEALHPGYRALIADWIAGDPLLAARRRLDAARWRDVCRSSRRQSVLLVTHDSGGGVERCVQDRCAALRSQGLRPLLLRPVPDRSEGAESLERTYLPGLCRIDEPGLDRRGQAWSNLRFALPEELSDLAGLLRAARPAAMEVHHLLGLDHAVVDLARLLGIPYEVRVHDYAAFCQRISLLGPNGRYCGEPDSAGCTDCIADQGSRLEEAISVPALLARSAAELAAAARVVTPSRDAALRLRRHFPGVRPVVEPHEADEYGPLTAPRPGDVLKARPGDVLKVCVVGAIGQEKGYDVLLACARDAAARALPLGFVLVGHSIDDARLIDTGKVSVTGPFEAKDAQAVIAAQHADIGFIPSIWPETWCLALGEAWRAGLAVAAFDLGAPAERIRATGRGWLLPLGMPVQRINNALLTLPPLAASRKVMQTHA